MPKIPCYLDVCSTGSNWDRDLELGGYIFFLIYLEPYEPLSALKFENTQNKDHPNINIFIFGIYSYLPYMFISIKQRTTSLITHDKTKTFQSKKVF